MFAAGTLINTGAVLGAGVLGVIFKSFQETLMKACGVAVLFVGLSGVLEYMLTVEDKSLSTQGTMLLIFSLVVGALLGEAADIEGKVEHLGEWLKKKAHSEGDAGFVEGFVNTSLIICIGAMAIVGSIQDGLNHDPSVLIVKAVLDAVIVLVNASIYGKGAAFSSLPILVNEGMLTILAAMCGSFLSQQLIEQISFVGAALVFCVGLNMVFGKIIKVGNILPAMLIPIVAAVAQSLF